MHFERFEIAHRFRGPPLGVVKPGDRCIVLGWPLGVEGRKRLAGTAIYAPNGRLAALARAIWIEVPVSTWN